MLTGRVGYSVLPPRVLYASAAPPLCATTSLLRWVALGRMGPRIVTPNGWTVGVGAEFLFLANWSVVCEYDYLVSSIPGHPEFLPPGPASRSI